MDYGAARFFIPVAASNFSQLPCRHGAGSVIVRCFSRDPSGMDNRTFTGQHIRTAGAGVAAAVCFLRIQRDSQRDYMGARLCAAMGIDAETSMAPHGLAAAYRLRYSHPCHEIFPHAVSLAFADSVRRWRPLVDALAHGGQLRRHGHRLRLAGLDLPQKRQLNAVNGCCPESIKRGTFDPVAIRSSRIKIYQPG